MHNLIQNDIDEACKEFEARLLDKIGELQNEKDIEYKINKHSSGLKKYLRTKLLSKNNDNEENLDVELNTSWYITRNKLLAYRIFVLLIYISYILIYEFSSNT